MSNYLAIATVTAGLQLLLRSAIAHKMPGAEVSTVRPEAVGGLGSSPGINLYLYSVTPNAALRNQDLPSRGSDTLYLRRPQVALDLLYLLTFHGKEDRYDPERLLSLAVMTLHTHATLGRGQILEAISAAHDASLAGSDLGSQPEAVRFTPATLSLDDLYHLWSLFSPVPYRLSMVYTASVVLLDADVAVNDALPVRTTQIGVFSGAAPVILSIQPQALTPSPSASIRVTGKNFTADLVAVIHSSAVRPTVVSGSELVVRLPAGLEAGTHSLRLVRIPAQQNGDSNPIAETDPVSFALQPIIEGRVKYSLQQDPRSGRQVPVLTLLPSPPLGGAQNADLILNPRIQRSHAPSLPVPVSLMRFAIESTFWEGLEAGSVSAALVHEFGQNGVHLSKQTEVIARSEEIRIYDRENEATFAVRQGLALLSVYYGITRSDPAGSISFQFETLDRGSYLVRLSVNGVHSPLKIDKRSGKYNSPTVEVT